MLNKKLITTFFLVMIMGIFASVLFDTSMVYLQKVESDGIQWDGGKEYPLEKEEKEEKTVYSLVDSFSEYILKIEDKIEKRVTSNYSYKMFFVETQAIVKKLCGVGATEAIGGAEMETLVLEDGDNYFHYAMDDYDISDCLDNLVLFAKDMQNEGRDFIYLSVPLKGDTEEIYGNTSLEHEHIIKECLNENGIDNLFLQDCVEEQGLEWRDMFFQTDHHWLPQTAIWADGILCEKLNNEYGYNIDLALFDLNNYTITNSEDTWLGSLGRKVTSVYATPEIVPIILPNFETDLTVFNSQLNDTIKGELKDTMFNWDTFEEENLYKKNLYITYGYGDLALLSSHNNLVNEGKKILLVRASFADAMIPYLALGVENLDAIDLRAFKGSLRSYIDETNPDMVIVIYGSRVFQRNEELFDFR